MFIEGTEVEYKGIPGIVSFVSNKYVSLLIQRGLHKSQDVKVVVYATDFDKITLLNSK